MMSPGQLARSLFGKHFHLIGEPYRRIFVDMDRVVQCMVQHIPASANILDVGGGDGYVADLILSRRPDVTATVVDLSQDVGSFIRPENRDRALSLPSTAIADVDGRFDVITISDVIHHVPEGARADFLDAVATAAVRIGCRTIIVKDIQPGKLRAKLALWGDIYITGDKAVVQVDQDNILIPGFHRTAAHMPDFPNYCLIFNR